MSFHVSQLLQQMQGQIDLGAARVGLFRATVSEVDATGRLVRLIRDGSTVAELEWRPVITGALPVVGARVNCLPYHAPGGQTPTISVIGTADASVLADGSVTTAKLADSSVTRAKRAGGPPRPRWGGGRTYFPDGLQGAVDTVTNGANFLRAVRIMPSQAYTVQGLTFEVMVAVTGDARVGIYSEHPTLSQPNLLLWDGGAVSLAATGIKNVTGAALSRGEEDPYWLALVPSVAVSLRGVVSSTTATGPGLGSGTTSLQSAVLSAYVPQTYGALPLSFGTPTFSVVGIAIGVIS